MNAFDDVVKENGELRNRITILEAELQFLRTHPTILRGIKGETLVATLTGGAISRYAESHDILLPSKATIEVKFSKLNTPVNGAKTRRWNWSKILGWKDKGKDFDFVLLIGEKDPRYLDQYIDSSPYVYFLIPKQNVHEIVTVGNTIGSQAQINTNLETARAQNSLALKKYIVKEDVINGICSAEQS